MSFCYLNFEFQVQTFINNKVIIVGNTPELGNWKSKFGC